MGSWLEDLTEGKVRAPKVGVGDVINGAEGVGRVFDGTTSLKSMEKEDRANLQEDLKELGVYNGKVDGGLDTRTSTDMIRALRAYALAKGMDPNEAVKIEEGGREAIVTDALLDEIKNDAGIKRTQGQLESQEPKIQAGLPNLRDSGRQIG